MGSQTILDLIASSVMFSTMLLIAIRLNVNSSDVMQGYRGDVLVQQNLVDVVTLLEYDFRKIGYCQDPTTLTSLPSLITYADTSRITFVTDVSTPSNPKGDGTPDYISYYVGSESEAANTPNPRDRLLYRVVNNETPKGINLGVTSLKFKYFKYNKQQMTTPVPVGNLGEIFRIEINVTCENLMAFSASQYAGTMDSSNYQSAYWKQVRLVARNMNLR